MCDFLQSLCLRSLLVILSIIMEKVPPERPDKHREDDICS